MVFILLPAYNEEEGIEKLLQRLARISDAYIPKCKVIIVNDGSADHTSQVVECFKNDLDIELIAFPENRGVVDVFRVGFEKVCALGKDEDVCITMDSDNTQNPFVILDILEKMESSCDIVIASRFAPGGKMVGAPFFRTLLSYGVALLMRRIANIPGVRDYSTFYRGVRVGLVRKGMERYGGELVSGHGFSGMAGLLVKLAGFSPKIEEVPFILRYDLKEGGSGMNIFKSIKGYLILMYQITRQSRR